MVSDDGDGEQEAHGEQEQEEEEAGDEGMETNHATEIGTVSDENIQLPQPEKKKRERKEPVLLVREAGKSLLPFSRVQKIIKADKDIPMVARDATFLISLATEEFIKRLSEASKRVAERERRSTVQHKDIATAVRRGEEFVFLEEIIPWLSTEPVGKRKPKGASGVPGAPTLLDHFVVTSRVAEDEEGAEPMDIVMNEDGTMVAGDGDPEIESNDF